jgi:hypothetical protein
LALTARRGYALTGGSRVAWVRAVGDNPLYAAFAGLVSADSLGAARRLLAMGHEVIFLRDFPIT